MHPTKPERWWVTMRVRFSVPLSPTNKHLWINLLDTDNFQHDSSLLRTCPSIWLILVFPSGTTERVILTEIISNSRTVGETQSYHRRCRASQTFTRDVCLYLLKESLLYCYGCIETPRLSKLCSSLTTEMLGDMDLMRISGNWNPEKTMNSFEWFETHVPPPDACAIASVSLFIAPDGC